MVTLTVKPQLSQTWLSEKANRATQRNQQDWREQAKRTKQSSQIESENIRMFSDNSNLNQNSKAKQYHKQERARKGDDISHPVTAIESKVPS